MTPLTQTLAALDEAATPALDTMRQRAESTDSMGVRSARIRELFALVDACATIRNALPALLELVAAVRADVEECEAVGHYCNAQSYDGSRWVSCGKCAACRVVAALRAVEGEGT